MNVSDIEITKGNAGSKEFVEAIPGRDTEIVNYQLQMLINNNIPGLLTVSRQQTNDVVRLMYDMTGSTAMSELTAGNGKISKRHVITLIDTFIRTLNGIREYQLPGKGILIDEDFIFFSKDGAEVSFVYLPLYEEDVTAEVIKPVLKDLVINDKIEITHDDFVQRLITVINEGELSEKSLRNFVSYFKGGAKKQPVNREQEKRAPRSAAEEPIPVRRETAYDRQPPQPRPRAAEPIREAVVPQGKSWTGNNKKEASKSKNGKDKNGTSKQKTIMAAVCGGLAVLMAAAYSMGLFTADGALRTDYLGAAVLLCALVVFLVYRELYSAKKDQGKKKTASEEQPVKKPSPHGVKLPSKNNDQYVGAEAKRKEPAAAVRAAKPAVPKKKPDAPYKKTAPELPQKPAAPVMHAQNGFDEDTEVMEGVIPEREAYLEYFENGMSLRIFIRGGSVLVGRQKSRVDHAIANNKVSKIHAEFGCRDNEFYVRDQRSANGTYINGGPRLQPFETYTIGDGDVIRIADVEMVLHCL